MAGPYSIGADDWNGLSKLIGEGGEADLNAAEEAERALRKRR